MSTSYIYEIQFVDDKHKQLIDFKLGRGAYEMDFIFASNSFFEEYRFDFQEETKKLLEEVGRKIEREDQLIDPTQFLSLLTQTHSVLFRSWRIISRFQSTKIRDMDARVQAIDTLSNILKPQQFNEVKQLDVQSFDRWLANQFKRLSELSYFISYSTPIFRYAEIMKHRARIKLIIG